MWSKRDNLFDPFLAVLLGTRVYYYYGATYYTLDSCAPISSIQRQMKRNLGCAPGRGSSLFERGKLRACYIRYTWQIIKGENPRYLPLILSYLTRFFFFNASGKDHIFFIVNILNKFIRSFDDISWRIFFLNRKFFLISNLCK